MRLLRPGSFYQGVQILYRHNLFPVVGHYRQLNIVSFNIILTAITRWHNAMVLSTNYENDICTRRINYNAQGDSYGAGVPGILFFLKTVGSYRSLFNLHALLLFSGAWRRSFWWRGCRRRK